MCNRFSRSGKLLFGLVALATWLMWPGKSAPISAQGETQPDGDRPIGRLVISSADASSAPTIVLHAYAMDGQGAPVNLTPQNVLVTHDGQQVDDVEAVGSNRSWRQFSRPLSSTPARLNSRSHQTMWQSTRWVKLRRPNC
jgi:hypothetical protein